MFTHELSSWNGSFNVLWPRRELPLVVEQQAKLMSLVKLRRSV